jgi:hypothetical protein
MKLRAKIAEVRRWVEAHCKISRQLILVELESERLDPSWLEKSGEAEYRNRLPK